jgi:hypothetical protein
VRRDGVRAQLAQQQARSEAARLSLSVSPGDAPNIES